MNIKLGQYKIFNEAATTLSFSGAAKKLYMSQSAVSQAINQLEKELGIKLFIRQAKSVVLTKEGAMLHKHINQALEIITTAENELSSHTDLQNGELIIGASDTLSQYFLPKFLVQYYNLYPNILIKVLNRTSLEIAELLKEGQIDIGFINMPIEDNSLVIKECLKIHDIFVSANKDENVYTNQEIAELPLILLEKNSNSRHHLDTYFAGNGILLQSKIEVGAHELLLKLANLNLGVSCVIKEFSCEYLSAKKLYELKLENPLPQRSIAFAYLKRRTLPSAAIKFLELLKS